MTWRDSLNSTFTRATGYRIVNATTLKTLETKAAKRSRPTSKATKKAPAAAPARTPAAQTPAAKPAPKSDGFDIDVDDGAKAIIAQVRPWTMTSNDKLLGLIAAARYVTRHGITGDFVECGVWRGGSSQAAALTFLEAGDTSRHLYLFDTYEGMPEPTEEDVRHDGKSADEMMKATGRPEPGSRGVWAYATIEDVRDGMHGIGYPTDRIHLLKGDVLETIPGGAPETISILRLDTDWYQSTKHELEHLYDRLVPGGVLILDDYGWWLGARRAVDEWLEEKRVPILLNRLGTGRIGVKPS